MGGRRGEREGWVGWEGQAVGIPPGGWAGGADGRVKQETHCLLGGREVGRGEGREVGGLGGRRARGTGKEGPKGALALH